MDEEMDRLQAITGSSLSKCRKPQFTFHFRGELPQYNVPGVGLPNTVALKFKCKNSIRKRTVDAMDHQKITFSSTWKIRHPEMSPNCRIAVPISYEGDWSRGSVVSLVFVVHNKRNQRLAYSKGEILLIDDICDDRFCLVMAPRDHKSRDDLKMPVLIHLLIDVWDIDAGKVRIRCGRKSDVMEIPREIMEKEKKGKERMMFERVESYLMDSEECSWPESTDFLIEIPIEHGTDGHVMSNYKGQCKFDENANLVLPAQSNGKRCIQFFCHQSILAKDSISFVEMFKNDWTKDANVLRIRSVSPSAVQMFLNYIYTGQLCPSDLPENEDGDARVEFQEIVEVVALANRYDVEGLRCYCDALLTDRYLNLPCAIDAIRIAERYELPLLGQAALSMLSLSLDEVHLEALANRETKHLLNAVVREARQKHMFSTVINPC